LLVSAGSGKENSINAATKLRKPGSGPEATGIAVTLLFSCPAQQVTYISALNAPQHNSFLCNFPLCCKLTLTHTSAYVQHPYSTHIAFIFGYFFSLLFFFFVLTAFLALASFELQQ